MQTAELSVKQSWISRALIIDSMAMLLLLFIPTLSHLTALPLYYLEPMRLGIIAALLYSRRRNALFLALLLPFFSLAIAAHPVLIKAILMSVELLLNVLLFDYLIRKYSVKWAALPISIVLSKSVYYLLKFTVIKFALLDSRLVSTPFVWQATVLAFITLYGMLYFRQSRHS